MSDFEFDKSFSEEFRQVRHEAPTPAQWERVSASLHQNEGKQRRRKWAFLLLPYLLTAATVALFAWSTFQQQRLVSRLEMQVGQLGADLLACAQKTPEPTSKPSAQAADAAQPFQQENRRDATQNMGFRPKKQMALPTNMLVNLASPAKTSSNIFTQTDTATSVNFTEASPLPTDSISFAQQTIKSTTAEPIASQAPAAEQLGIPNNQASKATPPSSTGLPGTVVDIAAPQTQALTQPKREGRPRRFGLGIHYSHTDYFIAIDQPRNRRPFYINLCFKLNNAWRLEAGYDGWLQKYSLTGQVYPTPPASPSQDYSFSKLDVSGPSNRYSMGIHRHFLLKKRLQPSLSVEFLVQHLRKYRLDYRYNSQNTNSPEITISQQEGKNYLADIHLRFGAGLSYRILPWLDGRAQIGCILLNGPFNQSSRYNEYNFRLGLIGYF